MWQVAAVISVCGFGMVMAWYAYLLKDATGILAPLKYLCLALSLFINLLIGNLVFQLGSSTGTTQTLIVIGAYTAWAASATIMVFAMYQLFNNLMPNKEGELS